ncbi:substrate-binding domain-containing protein [Coprococcus catus]|jgi:phosphate transport system substrate-binding protein|uniref:substrate-binding domain-containing protein n=1 Tax=Coprococcus catus TaxID=116085 RepID=UPI001C8C3F64|nr:substrate-binding domain-containing protein [Coprococcus catus]MBX9229444.1 solute-binding protein [Coprococcus catus]MCT6799683.1 substrate-binding domain-containing protein [Coprococcus catus]
MKKFICTALTLAMVVGSLAGCGSSSSKETTAASGAATEAATEAAAAGDFDTSKEISVNSREDGSGTRGAFIELFGVEEKAADGTKVDNTTVEANITNSTAVMMTSVAGDPYAIGYISLGSLNDTVKAAKIDGAEATTENVANGSYKVARPFNIVTKDGLSDVAKDFVDYIMSAEGQDIIEQNGYIKIDQNAAAYAGSKPEGKIVVAGSSSVSPVMEKLKEAYLAVNTNADIEIQTSDSTTGVTSTQEGICDIGMASRDLKDTETGVTATTIAQDGIAVIVNNENPVENLTSDQVKSIFTGETTVWADVQ